MFGATCFAVVCDDPGQLMVALGVTAGFPAMGLAHDARMDDMGQQTVVYFPGWSLTGGADDAVGIQFTAGDLVVMPNDREWGPGRIVEDETNGRVTVRKQDSGVTYHDQPARLFRKVKENWSYKDAEGK